MKNYLDIINTIIQNKFFMSACVIVISLIFYKIIYVLITKSENKSNKKLSKDKRTYTTLIKNFLKYAVALIVILVLLQINGVDVSSMMAGLGILSIVIGFIVQDAFKDIIRGMDILSDNYFSVGDIVKYKDIEGKVLMLGLKTTKIEDIRTFNIISIANRNIEQIELVSNSIDITLPLPYELSINKAEKIIKDIFIQLEKDERVIEYKYKGINNFGESSIDYFLNIRCKPIEKVQLRRDALRVIMLTLEKNNIQIPYKQLDVHYK